MDYVKIKGWECPSDELSKQARQELAETYAATMSLTFGKDRDKKSLQPAGQ